MKTLREQIENVISSMSYLEKVEYSGRISNPRQVAINRRYSTIRVESAELTEKRLRNKSAVFSESNRYTDSQIRHAIETLIDSAISWHEAREARFGEEERRRKASEEARKAKQAEWIAKLRIAKSGQSEKPIQGTEHDFRVFSNSQLVEAGTDCGAYSIRVPLPANLDKRAEFLAKLDSFIATL